jgi:hypothetical protein
MSDDEALARASQAVEEDGKRRFGDEGWSQSLGAIGKALAAVQKDNPGVTAGTVVQAAMQRPDPAGALFTAGREALIGQASEGDHDAEVAYSKIRQREREEHLRARGRMR